jgi:glycosyltransferase involved in cell wall biosynthesis
MTSIDIVLPYYNGSLFIAEQIESILGSNLEGIAIRLIIVNDASTTTETEFLKTLLPLNHLYLENKTNLGVIQSVEKGLSASTAPYIMLCDHDDVWLPQKIKHSLTKLQAIESGSPAMVFTDLIITGPKLEETHPSMISYYGYRPDKVFPSILFKNIVTGCTIIMNRKLIDFALPFPGNIPMHDHWLAVCAVFAGKLEHLNEPTILYRQHGKNQVGAPTDNLFSKIGKLNQTFDKFQTQLELKIKMTRSLSLRLNNPAFLNQIVNALETKNVWFLIRKNVVRGSFIQILGAIFFFLVLRVKPKRR